MAFRKPRRWVNKVFIHCSASDNPAHDNVATMRRWHTDPKPRGRGWSDVGYHFFIRKDGTLEAGRPLERIPAAQARHNRGSIAICLHGGGGTPPQDKFTRAQFSTLYRLCREIDEAYGGKVTFHGHREVAAKACPVFDYKKVLDLDADGRLGAGSAPAAAPSPDAIEEAPEDEIKPLRKSTTVQSVAGTGVAVTTGVVTVSENMDKLSATQTGILILCGLIVAGCLFWIWRERKRRGAEFGF